MPSKINTRGASSPSSSNETIDLDPLRYKPIISRSRVGIKLIELSLIV